MEVFLASYVTALWGIYSLKKRGYADFFFQLNLLPPYSLRSLGDDVMQRGERG